MLGSCGTVGGPEEEEMLSLVSSRVSASSPADERRAGGEVLNLKREERAENRLLSAPVSSGAESGSGAILKGNGFLWWSEEKRLRERGVWGLYALRQQK